MNAHTPTPWQEPEHDSSDISSAEWWDIPGIASVHSEQDAAFIVRACNSHEALVAALKNAKRELAANIGIPEIACVGGPFQEINAALAQAGEGA